MSNSDDHGSSASNDSSPDAGTSEFGDCTSASSEDNWIAALSRARIPSPPVQYDPRLAWRVSSPETPTPHTFLTFPTRVSAAASTSARSRGATAGSDSYTPITSSSTSAASSSYPSSVSSSPTSTLSRSTSCTSSLGNMQQDVYIPDIPVRPFISTLSKRISESGVQQPADRQYATQHVQKQAGLPTDQTVSRRPSIHHATILAASATQQPHAGPSSNSTHLQPIVQSTTQSSTSQLTRRVRPTSAHFAPDTFPGPARPSVGHPAAPDNTKGKGVSKLSRQGAHASYVSPTTGKKKSAVSRHAHKRSFSVQWQQFERWENKSRARLRDLLILLLVILCAAGGIYKLCASTRDSDSTGELRATAQIAPSRSRSSHRDMAKRAAGSGKLTIPADRHLTSLDHPERDTVILYRILGNDLPPRHERGQTLRNLRFMLTQESDFSFLSSRPGARYPLKVEKYYVLNRISDEDSLDGINALFEEYDVPSDRVLNIPFEWDGYRNASSKPIRLYGGVAQPDKNLWGLGSPVLHGIEETVEEDLERRAVSNKRWTGLPMPEKLEKQTAYEELRKLRALEYTLHEKNLYAMNNVRSACLYCRGA